jgi:hypothetical protein
VDCPHSAPVLPIMLQYRRPGLASRNALKSPGRVPRGKITGTTPSTRHPLITQDLASAAATMAAQISRTCMVAGLSEPCPVQPSRTAAVCVNSLQRHHERESACQMRKRRIAECPRWAHGSSGSLRADHPVMALLGSSLGPAAVRRARGAG